MKLRFLGTGSMVPGKTRNTSSLLLQMDGTSWMFDCGEGTQHQVRRCHDAKFSSIQRIFVTHLHGDHLYGIAGVMCSRCNFEAPANAKQPPLEVVGPPGLRAVIRSMLNASQSRLSYAYTVTELHPSESEAGGGNESELDDGVAELDGEQEGDEEAAAKTTNEYVAAAAAAAAVDAPLHPQERPGRNIVGTYGEWRNIDFTFSDEYLGAGWAVHAAAMVHTRSLLCLGYVVKEADYSGRLDFDKAKKLLLTPENREHFRELGTEDPRQLMAALKRGESVQMKSRRLYAAEVLGPKKRGRKVVVLGDTCDASRIVRLAANADVVVHEATNAFLPDVDPHDDVGHLSAKVVLARTIKHGHSTPQMAGAFAQSVAARKLILTHLSSRYLGLVPVLPTPTGAETEEEAEAEEEEGQDDENVKKSPKSGEFVLDGSERTKLVIEAIANEARRTFSSGMDVHVANDFEGFKIFGNWGRDPKQVQIPRVKPNVAYALYKRALRRFVSASRNAKHVSS